MLCIILYLKQYQRNIQTQPFHNTDDQYYGHSRYTCQFYFCFCVYGGFTYFLFYCQVFPPQAVVISHCLLNRCPNSKAACTCIFQVQAAFHFASAFCNSCCEHTAVPSFATTTPAAALAMCMASGRL